MSNFKTTLRIEKAIRLEAMGLPDADIAPHIGLTTAGLATLKTTPEYKAAKIRVNTGVVAELDAELGDNVQYLRTRMKEALPKALDVLVDALGNPDPKVRMNAAETILDRDGRLSKVSRIGLPTEEQGGMGHIDTTVADSLIASLQAAKAKDKNVQPDSSTGSP